MDGLLHWEGCKIWRRKILSLLLWDPVLENLGAVKKKGNSKF